MAAGTATTFIIAWLIVVWAVSGPVFGFSETWQLIINTGTTIITFLMVFLIQNSQNRDTKALHLKLGRPWHRPLLPSQRAGADPAARMTSNSCHPVRAAVRM